MGVDLCTYRARIGCFRNLRLDSQCCSPEAPCLLLRVASCLLVWMVISQLMLKLAGDVEENPGPRQQNIDMAKLSSFRNKMKPKEWDMMGKRTLLTLDLSSKFDILTESYINPLAQLPEEVFELKELEALDLTNNKNIDLSDELTKLTNLKLLCLDKCGLKTVPAAVMKLPQLEMLILSNNTNITLPDKMSGLSNLTALDLAGCNLGTLPPVVLKLSNLQELDLSADRNSTLKISLPDELSKLNKLKVLRLRSRYLDTIPQVVLKVPQLEELDLSGNWGIHLPDGLAGLTNLRVLKLVVTDMEKVPRAVLKLPQLEELDLSENWGIHLPDGLAGLTNLRVLKLELTDMDTVPVVVWRLAQLEWLDLSHNQLQTLPAEIGQLTNVKHLNLSRCKLHTLPPEVGRLTQLEWLNLRDNQLQTLPAEIGRLTNLKHLYLSWCKLRTLPPEVWRLTQLERLGLRSNQLQTLPAEIGRLTNLKHLDLFGCKLRTLPPEVGRLTQLKRLNLSNNQLQTLPAEIGQLTNVKHLDLSRCELRTLPPEVGRLIQLEWLDLSYNQLQTLPPEVGKLTQLERLDLSFNQLQTLPAEIAQLSSLRHLNVISNPLIKPPAEVCWQGIAAIRQYFDELGCSEENTSAHLKVVVLGEKMAGKTSLVQTLDSGESTLTEEEDRTHCVEITQWAPDDNITFEVYDFGGHDVYHLTHQFFLTPDAFYLLLVNLQTYSCSEERVKSEDRKSGELSYTQAVGFWLDTLNARVPGAVVTIVGSKMDMCSEAEINGKVKDIEEKFQKQMDTWKSNTQRQITTLNKRSEEAKSDEEQREIKKQLEHAQNLLDKPMRLTDKHVHCISSAGRTSGLDTLKNHILESADNTDLFPTLRKILPQTWVEFEQKVYGLREKGTEELEMTRSKGDKSPTENNDSTTDKKQVTRNQKWIKQSDCLRQGQLAGLPEDSLETVLSYLQQVGTILRYTDIPELKDLVFHDPPTLIELFKDLFHHDTKALFSTPRVEKEYTSEQRHNFEHDLCKRGLIRKDVMTCLLRPNSDIVTALMQHFGLCFEIQVQERADPSEHTCWYRIPCYLQKEMPPVWPEEVPEDQEQLQLMCNISGFCPGGLFQRFSVGIHPLVEDSVGWKDGVMAYRQDYIVLVHSKPVEGDTYITMATRGRLAQAEEMWDVVHPLLEVLVQLLQEWPGVLYSLHVTCAHCIKAGLDRPYQHELRDRTAEDGRDVRCPEVNYGASTSADLVYRPAKLSAVGRGSSMRLSQPEDDCYKMTSEPRGVALIISNTDFTDPTRNRPGGAKDLDRLGEICEKLKLQPEIKENLTAQEIEAVTKEVSKRDHSSFDCFVLFLLSHGTATGVLGTDGQHVSVDNIISSFQACKSLVGKPKLFFIQACRGGDRDKGLEQTDSATDEASSTSQTGTEASDRSTEATVSPPPPTTTWATLPTALMSWIFGFLLSILFRGDRDKGLEQRDSATDEASSASQTGTEASDGSTKATASPPPPTITWVTPVESSDAGETLPTASDRLVMYATVHGHVSWRNSNTGTWLVEALADVITKHADMKELHDMLMMVNAKVAGLKTQTQEHEYKQQPEVTHTLRKRLYFFPSRSSVTESSPQPERPQDHDMTGNPLEKEGGKDEVAVTSRESSDQRQDHNVSGNPPEELESEKVDGTSAESSDQHQDHNASGNPPEELESEKVAGTSADSSHQLKRSQDQDAPEKLKSGKDEISVTSAGSDVNRYFRYIKNHATAKWKDLADVLGLSWADVRNIEKRNSDDKSRCRDTLEEWKKQKEETASITVLMDALRELELMSVVDGLKEKYPELQEHDASGNPLTESSDQRQDHNVSGNPPEELESEKVDGTSADAERPVILLLNDEYGTSKGGISTINYEASQTLQGKAVVYATVLQLNVPKQDQEAAERDGCTLIQPKQIDKESEPDLTWLKSYHSIHFPDLPPDVTCIIGHADITDTAARRIKDKRYPQADLITFTHIIPEDTEFYKGGKKALKAREKEKDMVDIVDKAKAAFSVGRRIFEHFSTKYKGKKKPQSHHIFLPKPSEIFLDANVSPGGGEKVVLSIGRVRKVEKLKGHDLVAESMRDVVKKVANMQWCVRGISEDDSETSKKILEDALNSPDLNPTLLPYGTQEEIMEDMMTAHLVLMPSRSEPFGLVGLEAIAAGIPVLISDKTGLAEMITDLIAEGKLSAEHRNVIVETSVNDRDRAGDAKRWADRIVDILEHSDSEFEKAARLKRELVESRYWEKSHNAFLQACGVTAAAADQ